MGDDALQKLGDSTSLKILHWICNPSATTKGCLTFTKTCQRLHSVNMSGSPCFSSEACNYLLSHSQTLTSLDASFCHLDDDAFKEIKAPIVYLNLQGCSEITDKTLHAITQLPTLKYLFLGFNDRMTESGIRLIKALPLNILKIYKTR